MMDWRKLLSTTRTRELYQAGSSIRADQEHRTEFERDYGRAVFSAPVRRLQDKAQVFPLEPNDAVRTRLTHSMEVASVARSLADSVARILVEKNEINSFQASAIASIASTCGLVHDLGNPPFGHAGEVAIIDWFENRLENDDSFKSSFDGMSEGGRESVFAQDFLNFDGNPQTIRLLSKLQLVSDAYGMNLTCGTLSAACKYVPSSLEIDADNHSFCKLGHYASEADLLKRVRENVDTGNARNPIAFLVEAADDIVYATVDLEDGIKKGVLTWDACEQYLIEKAGEDNSLLNEALVKSRQKVDDGLIKLKGRDREEAMAAVFRTFAIGVIAPPVIETFIEKYDEIMKGNYKGELIKDGRAYELVKACKEVAREKVFPTEEVLKLEYMGRQIVHDLLDTFWFAASNYKESAKVRDFETKVYRLMSANYRNVFEESLTHSLAKDEGSLPEMYVRLQLVTDYICGMTDTFAQSLHKQLKNG